MAKKGQKYNKYSTEFKTSVVKEYLSGQSGGSISLAKKYNISYRTIDNWIYTYKRQGHLNDMNRYEILKKYQAFLKAQRERK